MTSELKKTFHFYLQVFVRNFCSSRGGVSRYAIDLAYLKYKCEKAGGRLKSDFLNADVFEVKNELPTYRLYIHSFTIVILKNVLKCVFGPIGQFFFQKEQEFFYIFVCFSERSLSFLRFLQRMFQNLMIFRPFLNFNFQNLTIFGVFKCLNLF